MQTTPNRAIPYYEPSDPADLAYISQAIAAKLDAILGKRYYITPITTASLTDGQAVATIVLPAEAGATRTLLSFTGVVGFSGAANQDVGLNVSVNAGSLVTQVGNLAVNSANAAKYAGLPWSGYIDRTAGTAVTVTVTVREVGGSNCYLRGDWVAQVLQAGEY